MEDCGSIVIAFSIGVAGRRRCRQQRSQMVEEVLERLPLIIRMLRGLIQVVASITLQRLTTR
jgi:uncharacterized membrane protein